MDFLARLGASWQTVGVIVVSTVLVYLAVIALTRLAGPRSLAKMSSFDFAATVAIGSTVASTALASTPLVNGVAALAMLYGLQYFVATLRRRNTLRGAADNRPMLLLVDGRVLEGNLQRVRVSREELWSRLRLSGVRRLEEVRAVVLETTGDMSVLTGDQGAWDDALLEGIRDGDLLRRMR